MVTGSKSALEKNQYHLLPRVFSSLLDPSLQWQPKPKSVLALQYEEHPDTKENVDISSI